MRKFIPIIFLLALVVIGCDVQRGRFVTTGHRSAALSQVGLVDIVEGYSKDKDALFQDLMYVLVVCPDVKVHGSGSGIEMGKYSTTLNYSWDAESGQISIQVQWNRDSDIIAIGDKKYARDKGNVFIGLCVPLENSAFLLFVRTHHSYLISGSGTSMAKGISSMVSMG